MGVYSSYTEMMVLGIFIILRLLRIYLYRFKAGILYSSIHVSHINYMQKSTNMQRTISDLVTTWCVYTRDGEPKNRARPKSPIFNTPLRLISRLFGFRSYKQLQQLIPIFCFCKSTNVAPGQCDFLMGKPWSRYFVHAAPSIALQH